MILSQPDAIFWNSPFYRHWHKLDFQSDVGQWKIPRQKRGENEMACLVLFLPIYVD